MILEILSGTVAAETEEVFCHYFSFLYYFFHHVIEVAVAHTFIYSPDSPILFGLSVLKFVSLFSSCSCSIDSIHMVGLN